jgi:hypothetical protein
MMLFSISISIDGGSSNYGVKTSTAFYTAIIMNDTGTVIRISS